MTNFRRTLRTTATVGAVGALFALFCVVAVERERRTAEREGLVASRFVPATSENAVDKTGKSDKNGENGKNGASVFVPFDSPRAQIAADRAVVEFLRTTERRDDSPEASGIRRARILEARRRFATSDVAEERRLRRVDDARAAADAVETLRAWTDAPDDGEFADLSGSADADFSVESSCACVDGENAGRVLNDSSDFNDSCDDFDVDLAAASAFLAELSDEPSASSVPLAPLTALDDAGDFRDAVVFLDANALTPVPVAVEAVVWDAAPRTVAVVGAFQAAFALFATFGARFFCVDWARFFSVWNVRRRGNVASAAASTRLLTFFERWGAARTLADLAVVRLLN
ncbi:MAG: hypothetical protein IJY15_12625 [Thermoguttaceae bacterium]|nr:hypothetical protein [Thermoguttaceae bacterium]